MTSLFPPRNFAMHSPLSTEQWQVFFTQGYCILKNLLSPWEVTANKKAMKILVYMARELAHQAGPNFDGRIDHQGALFVLKSNNQSQLDRLYRICGCGSIDPTLLETSRHPKLLQAFADILLSEHFEQLICQFHPKLPGDDVRFPPHRDVEFRLHCDPNWQDSNGWGSYAVAVIAIDPAGPENGGLQLLPGSHRAVRLDQVTPACEQVDPHQRKLAITPTLNPGDALLMHPYLIHWSEPNQSRLPRFSLLSGCCHPDANHENYPGDCTNTLLTAR